MVFPTWQEKRENIGIFNALNRLSFGYWCYYIACEDDELVAEYSEEYPFRVLINDITAENKVGNFILAKDHTLHYLPFNLNGLPDGVWIPKV